MIMSVMASQITGVSVVYSTVCSGADQRKHQGSASLVFVWGEFTCDWWIPRTNGLYRGKCFHLMTSSCFPNITVEAIFLWTKLVFESNIDRSSGLRASVMTESSSPLPQFQSTESLGPRFHLTGKASIKSCNISHAVDNWRQIRN